MDLGYRVSVWLHLLAAAVWVGGMAFLALTALPVLRRETDPETGRRLLEAMAVRFRAVAWGAIALLLVTGVAQILLGGYGVDSFRGSFGLVFAFKMMLVVTALATNGLHDFSLGPRALAADPASPEARTMRRVASWLGRLTFLLAAAILAAAVLLVRGLP